MENKIVVYCFEHDGEWYLGGQLIVGEQTVELQDGLISDTESFDRMHQFYQKIADGLAIPLKINAEVLELRQEWEEEENG